MASKQRIHDTLAVGIELTHLGTGVALSHNRQVDALGDVGLAAKGSLGGHVVALTGLVGRRKILRLYSLAFPDVMIRDAVIANLADKDVGGVHGMRQAGHHLAVKVGERDGDVNGLLGHGHIVTRGEGFAHLGGFLGSQPLLEERREGVDKQHLARGMVLDLNLAVALQGDVGEAALAARPLRGDIHLLQINLLGIMVTRKDIVQTKGAALKNVVKLLRHGSHSHNGNR